MRRKHIRESRSRNPRSRARRLDADIVVTDARMMTDRIGDAVASLRLMSTLAAVFAGLALVLATVGLHAIIAYDVGPEAP